MYLIHEQLIFYRYIFWVCLETLISSAGQNLKDILVSFKPIARNKVVTVIFLSVDISVHYAINICRKFYQDPLKRLLWQNIFCSIMKRLSKRKPWRSMQLRNNTRSAPLITKYHWCHVRVVPRYTS
jgi:hypothetical protein